MFRKLFQGLVFIAALSGAGFGAPGVMNYSGRLINASGEAVSAPATVLFSFYNAQAGGTPLLGYTYEATVTPNADGLYSIAIGDTSAGTGGPVPSSIFDAPAIWLNIRIGGEDLAPRVRIATTGYAFRADESTTAGAAIRALGLAGNAFVTAPSTGTAVENGLALLNAYQQARALRPNNQDLATTNRAVLLVPPGRYDLATQSLTLDTGFVDLVGMSSNRESQWITGLSNGTGTGVLDQTANNVHIENLTIECTRSTGILLYDSTDPAAYFPDAGTTDTLVKNCAFRSDDVHALSMRIQIAYPGTYADCTGGELSFGGLSANVSGSFNNCTGANYSFGGLSGDANGSFSNCTGGDFAFGGGPGGTVSGTFNNCTGGEGSFGGGPGGKTTGAKFKYCEGGINSFGFGTAQFLYCIQNGVAYP